MSSDPRPEEPRPPAPHVGSRSPGLRARATGWLRSVDVAVFIRLNRLRGPPIASWIMRAASRSMPHGEAWLAVAAAIALRSPHAGAPLLATVIGPLWLAGLTVNLPLKRIFRRPRPFDVRDDLIVVGKRPTDPSFPSGHAAVAFAGAWLLARWLPSSEIYLYGYAALVAFSRIYLGVHYPSDTLMGAITGIALAAAYYQLGLMRLVHLSR